MEVLLTPHFRRLAKRLPVSIRPTIDERMKRFVADPFDPILHTHKLSGKQEGFWSFSVDFRLRIIFEFDGKDHAIFHAIGDHSIYD